MRLALAAALAAGAACLNGSNPHFECPAGAGCWCTPRCNHTEPGCVSVERNLTFSPKYRLQLDLFQPARDNATAPRPAVVAVHGGGFSEGFRQSEGDWCRRFASLGYVCATVAYRVHPGASPAHDGLQYPALILNATEDVRAAVRYLRANAARFRIDPGRVASMGASAGAIVSAYLVTVPGEGDGGNPGFSSAIQAGVGLSGALLETEFGRIAPEQPPFLDLHGCCEDTTVPYARSMRPPLSWLYNAVSTHDAMVQRGARAYLVSFPGAGHIGYQPMRAAVAAHRPQIYAWLALQLGLSSAPCRP